MSDLRLDLDLSPEPPAPSSDRAAVVSARHRRALVAGLLNGRLSAPDAIPARGPGGATPPAAGAEASSTMSPCAASPDVADAAVAPVAAAAAAAPATAAMTRLARLAQSPPPRAAEPIAARLPARRAAAVVVPAPAQRATPDAAPSPALACAGDARRDSALQVQLDDAFVVPAGALLRGYLRARSLLLAGDIVGNVHCTAGPVVIRAGASLRGRLVASGDVFVCGSVGDDGGGAVISTRGKLILAPGARVDGDVRSGRLDLYDGAMLNGVAKAFQD